MRVCWGVGALSGILIWQSGSPYSLLSGRATVNRAVFSQLNTANSPLTESQLAERMSFEVDGSGGRVGRGINPGDLLNPPSGTIGMLQQRMFSGPSMFNLDAGLLKSIRIHEFHAIELRFESRNILNHTNWIVFNQNINAGAGFGRQTRSLENAREIQVGLIYRF